MIVGAWFYILTPSMSCFFDYVLGSSSILQGRLPAVLLHVIMLTGLMTNIISVLGWFVSYDCSLRRH